ncbi:MAG: 2-dehydro-3-deoxygalactonokinase [Alteromonadales bacterium]|nr:2-dehydro-3-deoxygalactonokinase [Alteromonadales bacterium]
MTKVITIDWGGSKLQANLCEIDSDDQLNVLDSATGLGINKVAQQFENELFRVISPWTEQYGPLDILMSGQVGANIGWKETQYLPCPISPKNLAKACLSFKCRDVQIKIVPGVNCYINDDYPDVMRGEELQILGWLQTNSEFRKNRHLVCLPGTHTKWALVEDGEIKIFRSAMTGELFDLLSNNSVLIQKSEKDSFNQEAFLSGVNRIKDNGTTNEFYHCLFSVRTKQLLASLAPKDACSYLSGLLIGADVRSAIESYLWDSDEFAQVSVIGARHISHCFETTLQEYNKQCTLYDANQVSIKGYQAVLQQIYD